jgi:hypothetical protein
MSTRKSTPATKTGRASATALGMLLCASAHTTPAASVDSEDALPAGTTSYGYFREARGGASEPAQRTDNFNEIRGAEVVQRTVLARLNKAFGIDLAPSSDRAKQSDSEVLLRNADAFVRAKVRLTLGQKWHSFVYADMGAADSALRWQGMAGISGGHGIDLLGGWRHVTYHFSPGMGFDSLDFNGPFLGATLTW